MKTFSGLLLLSFLAAASACSSASVQGNAADLSTPSNPGPQPDLGSITAPPADLAMSDLSVVTFALAPEVVYTSVAFPQEVAFSAKGGVPPYTYAIVSGPGSIDSSTGVFTSTSILVDTIVEATDGQGWTATATIHPRRDTVNAPVRAIFSDSTEDALYVGGDFTHTYPLTPQSIFTVKASTGEADLSVDWKSGFDGAVVATALVGNSLYLGGQFTKYRGVAVQNLVKIDLTTGELDTGFSQATGFDNGVWTLLASGSSLYVGGTFSSYRGAPAKALAKIDLVTGALDTVFTQAQGTNGQVLALAASGTSLYVGGDFTTYRGDPAEHLAKLDLGTGSLDTSFTQSTGFDYQVRALLLQGNALYAGGDFTTYRTADAQHLAKLDTTSGALDTTFTKPSGFNNTVRALILFKSALYAGGYFLTYRGTAANRLAKLDPITGDLDGTFTQATGFNGDNVYTLAASEDDLYVGGAFTSYRGASTRAIAKLDPTTGALDTAFAQTCRFDFITYELRIVGDKLIALGAFWNFLGWSSRNLVKIDGRSGAIDTTFTRADGFDASVHGLGGSATDLFVAGAFQHYRGADAQRLAKLDRATGELDTAFTQATGFDAPARVVAVDGSSVYVGGDFTHYRGAAAERLAKLDVTTGALDATFTQMSGFDGPVYGVHRANGALYVAGAFSTYRGVAAQNLAKLDAVSGALDTSFTQATGLAGGAARAVLLVAGSLYVAGSFETYRGVTAAGLAKLDPSTGDLDTTFTQATGFDKGAYTLAGGGTTIFVGGEFATYRGAPASRLAKLDATSGALDTSFTQATGYAGTALYALELRGELRTGGDFTGYRSATVASFLSVDATSGSPLRGW